MNFCGIYLPIDPVGALELINDVAMRHVHVHRSGIILTEPRSPRRFPWQLPSIDAPRQLGFRRGHWDQPHAQAHAGQEGLVLSA